jgi:formylglycine-generating enzyme required for sulfatase activity
MLIDRHNSRDHQAQLHNSFYETLKTNNIYVERFYFDNSPLVCRNHRHEGGIALSEILNLYEHAVLMVFTDGLQFIDTMDVKIFKWAMVFKHWQHRFFFSSVSPSYWGIRERLLQQVFRYVLPLSVEGIQTMASDLSQTVNTLGDRLSYWQNNADYSLVPVQTVDKQLETIGLFFKDTMKRWIAACAVYPELNWNLTLALGKMFSGENTPLNSHRHISQLLRLDWFKLGRIPDVFRTALIEKWLSAADRTDVHQFLYDQLGQNTPLPAEPDYESRKLQLAVYDLLRQKNSGEFEQKAGELKKILETSDRLPDMVSIHLINEHEMSSIYFEIPESVLIRMGVDPSQTKQANKIPANFVLIQGGVFTMGSPKNEVNRYDEETQHQVKLSDFYLCKYAVTVADFKKFVDETKYLTEAETGDGSYLWNGKDWKKEKGINWRFGVSGKVREQTEFDHPVVHVSWNDVLAYCKWLTDKTGRTYRLPTEAEWEYACRAGTKTPFNTGDNLTADQANYNGNYPYNNNKKGTYRENTVPVNHFQPNALGLYNMHGNVWEWCGDWYDEKYYDECKAMGTVENPEGPQNGSGRVVRGGSWYSDARGCRTAIRDGDGPGNRSGNGGLGFRLVFVP